MDAIREAGGEVYAVTSEPHTLALNAQEDWDTGFVHVGDPHHEILDECKSRGWLSVFVWHHAEISVKSQASWTSHPNGFFQPGILAVTQQGRVLYRWRSRPNRKNVGGAAGRPTAEHVWQKVRKALDAPADSTDAALDEEIGADLGRSPWPIFVGLLFANGWFVRPKFFDQRAGGDPKESVPRRIQIAQVRLIVFVLAWIAAFITLPLIIPAVALAAYALMITPNVIALHKAFQNVSADEEPVD